MKNRFLLLFGLTLFLASCTTQMLVTDAVAYQSVRPLYFKPSVPTDATISVGYHITCDGLLEVTVFNKTDHVMTIDQTKSFVVNSDGTSMSFYDPTVRVTSETSSSSSTNGASVNLGAIAGAVGVGGRVGTLLSGVNVGGANTDGSSTTQTTYFSDQPQISIGPHGSGSLSKQYEIYNLGRKHLSLCSLDRLDTFSPKKK